MTRNAEEEALQSIGSQLRGQMAAEGVASGAAHADIPLKDVH